MVNKRAIGVVVVLLAAVLGASSCGGDSTGGDGAASPYVPPAGPVAEAEFIGQLPRALCQALAPCCAEAGRPMKSSVCRQIVAALATDMQAPDTTYDPTAAQECLTALAAIEICDETAINDESCNRVYAGTVALGGACDSDSQCAPQADGEATCDLMEQVCIVTKRGSNGDPCSATCESQGNGWACSGTGATPGLAEHTEVECWLDDGLYCSVDGCAALGVSGEDCSNGGRCAAGTYCDMTTRVCTEAASIGEACATTGSMVDGSCDAGTYCTTNGVCAAQKADGESCESIDECLGFCSDSTCQGGDPLDEMGDSMMLMFCG